MRVVPEWTQRLGFLVPSVNAVVERDAVLSLPPGISAHFARIPITRDEPEQLDAMADAASPAAALLAHSGCNALVFACTTGSLYRGQGYDDRIARRITATTGIPASTTATAIVRALSSLAVTRVLLVSPYEPWLDALVKKFLDAHGVTVVATCGPALPDPRDCDRVHPAEIAAAVGDPGAAEAVLISCTAFRGLEAAGLLRERLNVPVVSSNEATFWAALLLAGCGPQVFPRGGYLELRQ